MYPEQRKKLGFLVKNINSSELVYSIMMKAMSLEDLDVQLFFVNLDKAVVPNTCATMHIAEAFDFDGPVIATNIDTANKLINFPGPTNKLFFIDELEWMRYPVKQYKVFESIYRNPKLKLLARCEDHKRLIENCWNVKVYGVIESYNFFELEFIRKIVQESKQLFSGKPRFFDKFVLNLKTLNI